MIPKLDSALANYHDKIKIALNKDVKDIPGAGAAGGLGTGLLALPSHNDERHRTCIRRNSI